MLDPIPSPPGPRLQHVARTVYLHYVLTPCMLQTHLYPGSFFFRTINVFIVIIYVQSPPSHHNRFTALFRDHPGELVPEENFWTLWCKGRLTEADILTIRLGATPSRPTSAPLHHPPIFFTGWMPFLPPNQQCQITEGN